MKFFRAALSLVMALTLTPLSMSANASTPPSIGAFYGWNNPVGRDFKVFLTAELSEPVTVTGAPKLSFRIGDQSRIATFYRVRSGIYVDFEYLVTATDKNGEVEALSIDLNGGSINSSSTGTPAELGMPVGNNVMDTTTPSIDDQGPRLIEATVNGDLVTFHWDDYVRGWTNFGAGQHLVESGKRIDFYGGYFPETDLVTVYPGYQAFLGPKSSLLTLEERVQPGSTLELISTEEVPFSVADAYWNTSVVPLRVVAKNVTPISTKPHLGKATLRFEISCAGDPTPNFLGAVDGVAYYSSGTGEIVTLCGVNLSSGQVTFTKAIELGGTGSSLNFVELLSDRIWIGVEDGDETNPNRILSFDLNDTVTSVSANSNITAGVICLDALREGDEIFLYCILGAEDKVLRYSTVTNSWTSSVGLGPLAWVNGLVFEMLGTAGGKIWLGSWEGPTRGIDIATGEVSEHNPGRSLKKIVSAGEKSFAIHGSVLFERSLLPMSEFDPTRSLFSKSVDLPGDPEDLATDGTHLYAISSAIRYKDIGFLTKYDDQLNKVWSVKIPNATRIIEVKPTSILLGFESKVFAVSTSGPLMDTSLLSSEQNQASVKVSLSPLGQEGTLQLAVSKDASFTQEVRTVGQSVSGDVSRDVPLTAEGLAPGSEYFIAPVFASGGNETYGYPIKLKTPGSPPPTNNNTGGGGGGGGGGFFPAPVTPATPISSNPLTQTQKLAVLDDKGEVIEVAQELATDKKSISLSFGAAKLSLSSTGATFSDSGKLTAAAGANLTVSATGYQPDTLITGYLVPTSALTTSSFKTLSTEPILLGTQTVDQDGKFTFSPTLAASSGTYLLQLSGTALGGQEADILLETQIGGASASGEHKTWAKKMSNGTQAKLYAKNIVGLGKVSFRVNGKEIAWANATSSSDKKLRIVGNDNYLVRTINLTKGKNVLEVWVGSTRQTRVVFSR